MERLTQENDIFIKVLADTVTHYWFVVIPGLVPMCDNRIDKYTKTATASLSAMTGQSFDNFIPLLVDRYKNTNAYVTNTVLTSDVVTSMCIECCRVYLPAYIFEMSINSHAAIRKMFNSIIAYVLTTNLAHIREMSDGEIQLVLSNNTKLRHYMYQMTYDTLIARRKIVYDRAVQSDLCRTETPDMLRAEITRLKNVVCQLQQTLNVRNHKITQIEADSNMVTSDMANHVARLQQQLQNLANTHHNDTPITHTHQDINNIYTRPHSVSPPPPPTTPVHTYTAPPAPAPRKGRKKNAPAPTPTPAEACIEEVNDVPIPDVSVV